MKTIIHSLKYLSWAILLVFQVSCLDIEDENFSDVTGEALFENPENIKYTFPLIYTPYYQIAGHKYSVGSECGTDLTVVPQRGGDWYDGGEWHRWHRLTFDAKESYFSHYWNNIYKGISSCNKLLLYFDQTELDPELELTATSEIRAMRAHYYYRLCDMFGNVPLDTIFDVPEGYKPQTVARESVYQFIERELLNSIPYLNDETGINTFNRANKYMAEMTLAKLYLNAGVYSGTSQFTKAEEWVDSIMLSGKFDLAANYFDNFGDNAYLSPEMIFGVAYDQVFAEGFELHLFTLHYNLPSKFGITTGSWNGLAAQESLYNYLAEDAADTRLNGLLFGPQFNEDGTPITDPGFEKFPATPFDPDGINLNLTPAINMLEPNCLRQAGARIAKWQYIDGTTRFMSNDFAVFRYADVVLMKAELLLRKGDAGGALTVVNDLRQVRGAAALAELTEAELLEERARELYIEGFRRQDLIRFEHHGLTGAYTGTRWEKPEVSESYVMLFPIPDSQIKLNDNLDQNPGYE